MCRHWGGCQATVARLRAKSVESGMSDAERKARLAQALRQNLRRRKGQARGDAGSELPADRHEAESQQD